MGVDFEISEDVTRSVFNFDEVFGALVHKQRKKNAYHFHYSFNLYNLGSKLIYIRSSLDLCSHLLLILFGHNCMSFSSCIMAVFVLLSMTEKWIQI